MLNLSRSYSLPLGLFLSLTGSWLLPSSCASLSSRAPATESAIHESVSMEEAVASADADTLLVFDVDSTLIKSAQMLGGEAWVHEVIAKGGVKAFEDVYPVWAKVHSTPGASLPVEPGTPNFIRAKTEGVAGAKALVLSLAMSQFMKERKRELSALGFNFAASAPVATDLKLDAEGRVLYSGGMILASFGDKGASLVEFLHQAYQLNGYRPKRVIFVDDKREHVESVHRALEREGIAHTCFRYGAADGLYALYRPEIAELQRKALLESLKPRLMGDEEAIRRLKRPTRRRGPVHTGPEFRAP